MTEPARLERGLRRILWELRDYLPELVVIGGWVPYLHRQYGGFRRWDAPVLLTVELDVLLEHPLPRAERPSLPDLLHAASFLPAGAAGGNAVWIGEIEAGEKIEFLTPHRGTARGVGLPVPVAGQAGLAAIPLPQLDLLAKHTTAIRVPVGVRDGEPVEVEVQLPTLGAYVLNKACTFAQRRAREGGSEPSKQAKDLLYLCDLMAAGPEVVSRIEHDLAGMVRRETKVRAAVRYAANHVSLLLRDPTSARLHDVAAMMTERDPALSYQAARADAAGNLTDLFEILSDLK